MRTRIARDIREAVEYYESWPRRLSMYRDHRAARRLRLRPYLIYCQIVWRKEEREVHNHG